MRFPPLLRRLALALLAFGLSAAALRAHDSLEISADVKVRPDHLEFVMTLARTTAAYASGKTEAERVPFEPGDFERAKPRLIAAAREFFLFRMGEEAIVPRTVEAVLTIEDDVELRLTYPRPAAGKMSIKGRIFSLLPPEGYGSTFHCQGPKGEQLTFKFINAEDPFAEANLPPIAAKSAEGAGAASEKTPADSGVAAPRTN